MEKVVCSKSLQTRKEIHYQDLQELQVMEERDELDVKENPVVVFVGGMTVFVVEVVESVASVVEVVEFVASVVEVAESVVFVVEVAGFVVFAVVAVIVIFAAVVEHFELAGEAGKVALVDESVGLVVVVAFVEAMEFELPDE